MIPENKNELKVVGGASDLLSSYKLAPEGLAIEFGVYSGTSIRTLSTNVTDRTIYGFDSFEGLPEAWMGGYEKGYFKTDVPTDLPKNVVLVKGWFEDTLPKFLEEHKEPITFIHIDCDLYSSTKTIFDNVKNRLADNCIIAFDELYDYGNDVWKEHEFKAFNEFLEETKYNYECICLWGAHQAAFKLWR